jgi:hypothetical protein
MEYRYRLSSISKKRRYRRTSISLYTYIEDFSISTNAPSISVYDIEAFFASISNFVFFDNIDIGVFLLDPAWAAYSVKILDTACASLWCAHCIANQSLRLAHVPPGPPSAAAAEAALGVAAAPAAPGAAPAAAAGAGLSRRSGGRSRRRGHQRNARARDSWRQELTGAKFGMMIWTRIGRSCRGLLQTETMSKFSQTLTKW